VVIFATELEHAQSVLLQANVLERTPNVRLVVATMVFVVSISLQQEQQWLRKLLVIARETNAMAQEAQEQWTMTLMPTLTEISVPEMFVVQEIYPTLLSPQAPPAIKPEALFAMVLARASCPAGPVLTVLERTPSAKLSLVSMRYAAVALLNRDS